MANGRKKKTKERVIDMGDFLFGMAVSVILTVLKECQTDPIKKEKMRKAMLKIRDQITLLYEGPNA